LRERRKELDCLYGISRLVEQPGIDFDGILKGVVSLIPPAWQHPDVTCARIVFGEKTFESNNFKESVWKQSAPILVQGKNVGILEVYYLEEKPVFFEGPFLEEERALIDAIAERLGRITERIQAEESLRLSEEKHRTLFETMTQGVVYQDSNGRIVSANPAAERILGLTLDQMQGRTSADPRWEAIHEDGSDFPGETHPSMVALKTGKEVRNVVMGVFDPNSEEYRWININAVPQFKPGETKPFQAYATFEDITERRRLEEGLRERGEEIKKLNAGLVQRLVEKIDQIEHISKLREHVRRVPDVSSGLDPVLETALRDLRMDVAAVFVIDPESNSATIANLKDETGDLEVDERYPLDAGFVELEAAKETKVFSRVLGQGERSILRATSVSCCPMLRGKEVYGILALGSRKDIVLEDSDLQIVGLYSELVSTLFELHALTVVPVKESAVRVRRRFEIERGEVYLVKDNVERAFRAFQNALSGLDGLCITRELPKKIRAKYGLKKTPIVWLADEKGEGETTVHSLQDLSILIDRFLEKSQGAVVLLDGLEYLIVNHGFERCLRFLQISKSRIQGKNSILLVPLFEEALDPKQTELVERETKVLTTKKGE
jgi:PAS domain S-box-containing protein